VPKPENAAKPSSGRDPVSATTTEQKRKYRRHPKNDENAPEKPPSAYVLFSNRVREEVKAENLSFTEIARLVGEKWQKLDPNQKELFESHAGALKESYNKELTDYKKTDAYKEYMQYLADFKAKNAAQTDAKRPKLEYQNSSSLSGNSIPETAEALAHQIPGHARQYSIGSASTTSQAGSSTLPLATVTSLTSVPERRRVSPSYQYPQERRLLGQLSGHSSLSDDSPAPRWDSSDTLSRAATLCLGTPPGGSPSPSDSTAKLGRRDYGFGFGSQQWPNRQGIYGLAPDAAATSPGSTVPSLAANAVAADQWRDRSAEASFYNLQGGLSVLPQQQTSSVPISQLIDGYDRPDQRSMSSQMTLPPLRNLPGSTGNTPATASAGLPTSSAFHTYHNTIEQMAVRHLPGRAALNESESEAADTLAALAER